MENFTPKTFSPEEIVKIQTSRTLHDAKLIKSGAEYVSAEYGELMLEVPQKEIDSLEEEMTEGLYEKFIEECIESAKAFDFSNFKILSSVDDIEDGGDGQNVLESSSVMYYRLDNSNNVEISLADGRYLTLRNVKEVGKFGSEIRYHELGIGDFNCIKLIIQKKLEELDRDLFCRTFDVDGPGFDDLETQISNIRFRKSLKSQKE